MEESLRQLIDENAIRNVIYRYCHAIDRRDPGLLRSIAIDSAPFSYGIFEGTAAQFADYASEFLKDMGPTQHNVTNILIALDGDRARSESYCIAVHGDVPDDSGLIDLVVYVRYVDEWARSVTGWKITRRTVVYDWNQNLPRTARWAGPLHGAYLPRGAAGNGDPSYGIAPRA